MLGATKDRSAPIPLKISFTAETQRPQRQDIVLHPAARGVTIVHDIASSTKLTHLVKGVALAPQRREGRKELKIFFLKEFKFGQSRWPCRGVPRPRDCALKMRKGELD